MKKKTTNIRSKSKIEPSKTTNPKATKTKGKKSPGVMKSMNKSESKSKIEPLKKNKTPNSKATTTKKGWSSGVKNKQQRQTDEEYMAAYLEHWKQENDYSIELEKRVLIYEAEKEKHEIQEFRNRLESLGYCFSPSERKLIDYYLRSKNSDKEIAYCPIEEVDVYANHPQGLIENYLRTPGKVGYFFTRSHLTEIQSGTNIQGHWMFVEKEDVLNEGEKVGEKQVFEYCEGDHSTGYKISQYQLDPAPVDRKAWFICKLWDGENCLVGQNHA